MASNSDRGPNSFMPLYGGDYLRDTMHLSAAEDGIYLRLLLHYWHSQRPLPTNRRKLEGVARVQNDSERGALDAVMSEFFDQRDDGWHNKRMDREIDRSNTLKQRKSLAGRKGNMVRWSSDRRPSLGDRKSSPATATATAVSKATATPPPPSGEESPEPPLSPAVQKRTPRRGNGQGGQATTGSTWDAYRGAYFERYGVEPVRNAVVNAHLSQVVKRLGAEEAPQVAAFFLTHRNGLYVNAKHPTNLLLRDCEGLRTEWASGRMVTRTEAALEDRTQATANAFSPLLAEAKERAKNGSQ